MVELGLQSLQKSLVRNFDLPISLGATHTCKMVLYAQIIAKFGQLKTTEQSAIIYDDNLRKTITVDNGYLYKILYSCFNDFCEWLDHFMK